MRLATLRRRTAPLVIAALIVAIGLVAGQGSWTRPWATSDDTVRAVVGNGRLDPGDDTTAAEDLDDLVGAHPVDPRDVEPRVETAAHRESVDVSDTALPARVLAAYRAAARTTGRTDPGCRLDWPLLAGIGKVESGHASGGAVDSTGRTLTPILGPVLSGGPGVAAIRDTDGGRWDGDSTWDRAVGPMQFIPSSWSLHGADGNGDDVRDPNNINDAALASAGYLCTGERDVQKQGDRRAAVFSYNHSWDYVDLVLAWADAYAGGTPVLTGDLRALASAGVGSGSGTADGSGSTRRTGGPVGVTPGVIRPTGPADPGSSDPAGSDPGSTTGPGDDPTTGGGRSTTGPSAGPTDASTPPPSSDPSPTGPADPGCPTPTSTASPTPTGSASPSGSATPTSTASASPTPTDTPSATPSPTVTDPSATSTSSSSPTPSGTC
jgi:membrane-bound lytic murein transglycosylase B